MSLLSLPFRIPLLPVTGLIRLAELLEQEAERQLDAEVRRQLEEAEEARLSGEASDEEIAQLEELALSRLTGWQHDVGRGRIASPPEEHTADG